jgi:hypothetical protein
MATRPRIIVPRHLGLRRLDAALKFVFGVVRRQLDAASALISELARGWMLVPRHLGLRRLDAALKSVRGVTPKRVVSVAPRYFKAASSRRSPRCLWHRYFLILEFIRF